MARATRASARIGTGVVGSWSTSSRTEAASCPPAIPSAQTAAGRTGEDGVRAASIQRNWCSRRIGAGSWAMRSLWTGSGSQSAGRACTRTGTTDSRVGDRAVSPGRRNRARPRARRRCDSGFKIGSWNGRRGKVRGRGWEDSIRKGETRDGNPGSLRGGCTEGGLVLVLEPMEWRSNWLCREFSDRVRVPPFGLSTSTGGAMPHRGLKLETENLELPGNSKLGNGDVPP